MDTTAVRSGSIRQSLSTVVRAELRRNLRRRATVVLGLVSVLAGTIVGLALWAALGAVPGGDLGTGVRHESLALQVGTSITVLVMSFGVLSSTTRDTVDGTVVMSMILVPRRGRLLAARAAAPVVVVVGTTAALCLVLGGLLAAVASPYEGLPATIGMTSLVSLLVGGLVALLAFCTATCIRRGAATVAVVMLGVVVLPLVVLLLQFVGPPALAPLWRVISAVMPGSLAIQALSVPAGGGESWGDVLTGLAGLAIWCAALAAVAFAQFRREGARA